MIPIPDHPIGERFCRKCALFLPLANFFKGKRRRYECKAHSRGRPRKAPAKKWRLPSSEQAPKTSSPQRNKAVTQVWHAAYTDCRSSFGQATVGMSQGELRELFEATGVAEPSTAFRLVPVDPCRALATGNARMAALDERGPDQAAVVVEGPGPAVPVDEAAVGEAAVGEAAVGEAAVGEAAVGEAAVGERWQLHGEKGEAEKEELDDDDDEDDDDEDDDDDKDNEEDDEAKTATETEAATEAMEMDMTTTATCTTTAMAHGGVGV